MKLVYVHDFRFYKVPEGDVYTAVGLPEMYFDRFFDAGVKEISLVSRSSIALKSEIEDQGFRMIRKLNIKIPVDIESYFSLLNPELISRLVEHIRQSSLVVINFPSVIGSFICLLCMSLGKPYALEVAADYNQFSTKRLGFLFTLYLKLIFPLVTRRAIGALYVGEFLRRKYPSPICAVSSNVNISCISERPPILIPFEKEGDINILFVGALNKRKGVDIAIKAVSKLVQAGYSKLKLHLAGGHVDFDISSVIKNQSLGEHVIFHGLLDPETLGSLYKMAHIYVQPSRSEGIPRATLEAMSYGLPVVATKLPGFREVLPEQCLIDCSADDLSAVVTNLLINPSFYNKISDMNLTRASDFLYFKLHSARTSFFKSILREVVNEGV